jgi:hypothetical protein
VQEGKGVRQAASHEGCHRRQLGPVAALLWFVVDDEDAAARENAA